MKNTDEFYEDIEENKKLINSKDKKGYLEYANQLVKDNSLVQLIGCHSFYLKSDLDQAVDISKAIPPKVSANGNLVGPPRVSVPVMAGCGITVPDWIIDRYKEWLEENDEKTINGTKAFWATDTRIGIVIDKSNKEKEDYMEDYSRGEVVKVHWFDNPDSHFTGIWNSSTDGFDSISFHHVRNLRDISEDGPIEKKIYACNFNEGVSSFY